VGHHRQERAGPSSPPILMLWQHYRSLKSVRDELYRKVQTGERMDYDQMALESEELEPILLALDSIAMQIADAKGDWQSEIRIKAKVLLDYVDAVEGDAVHQLASSLCKSVLALQVVSSN